MNPFHIHGHPVELARRGSGEPVVLLHCSGSSGAQWRSFADHLGDRFLTLAPDFYGHGGTPAWPGYGEFTLADEAALVLGLIDSLHEPVHLVGHSYGGAIALQVARARPGRLRSLALIEPVAVHLLRDGDGADRAALGEFTQLGDAIIRSLCRGDYQGGSGRFVDYWSGPGTWAAMPIERRSSMAAGLGTRAIAFHALAADPCCLEDCAQIAVPTLLLQGSRTTPPPRRICDRLARVMPFAHMQVIKGAGHMSPLTHRDQVNELLAAHLEANAGAQVRAALCD